jgi:spoIIIJ-associated protein
MPESGTEFIGKSVDEAIADGLAQLGLRQDQVEIEIVSRGSRGIFGLGSEPAKIRIVPLAAGPAAPAKPAAAPKPVQPEAPAVTPSPAPRRDAEEEEVEDIPATTAPAVAISDDELAALATEFLDELVRRMGFDAQVVASWHAADNDHTDRYLLLDIHGHDLSALIGRRGETLAGIQYLVRLMVNQRIKQWKNIVVDVEQYKERRVTQLTQLALRMADQVMQSGRAVSLEPMPANERRIVHLALRDHPKVYTQSSGEGERRKVHIVARS